MAATIVITGASGFLGKNIFSYISTKYNTIAYSRKIILKNCTYIKDYKKIVSGRDKILIYLSQSSTGNISNLKKELNLVTAIAKKKWNYIIYISSYTVYFDSRFKIDEKGMIDLSNDYNALKVGSENIFLKNRNAVCLRISNIFGKHYNSGTLLSDIITQVKSKKCKNVVLQNKNILRDFLSINDLCNLLFLCIKKKPKGIYNVGSGKGISGAGLASKILRIIKVKKKIKTIESFFSKKVLDITKIQNRLSWKSNTKINKELKKILI